MDYIFNLGPSFSKKFWFKVKISAIFLILPKIGIFSTLKLEKKFFEDLNLKCKSSAFQDFMG